MSGCPGPKAASPWRCTLRVRAHSPDGAAVAAATGPRGFSDGLAAGWDALLAVTRALGVTAGALLPFSPVLLIAAALVWRSRRRTPKAASA